MEREKEIIGCVEWCALPEFGLPAVKVRVDSGAKTSVLSAFAIKTLEKNGQTFVQFKVHPLHGDQRLVRQCEAPLIAWRNVRSSNGLSERRPIVSVNVVLGDQSWSIEVSLTNRTKMEYRMLLGREALQGRYLVDPEQSFCLGDIAGEDVLSKYDLVHESDTKIKLLLLASNPELYSNRRIMNAALERGHEITFVNTRHCYVNINSEQPVVYDAEGELISDIDVVIPRLRPSITFYGCSILRQLQANGVTILNRADAITKARDKLLSLQILAENGIPLPTTGFANSPQNTRQLIEMVGGAPLIVKLLEGTQGRGVVLAETDKAAESVINGFKSLKANILVQEFIQEARGRDLRCFVVGGKVVGAMERVAVAGEFRANVHLGGTTHPVKLTAEERKISIKAAKLLGLQVAGVDLVRSQSGPRVLEVNASPGLQGIEAATQKDLAGMIIACAENGIAKKRAILAKRKS